MAATWYMNLEVLALEIVDECLVKMTQTNTIYDDDAELDIMPEELFHNNLKQGCIIVSMLNNYVESMVNTIFRECVGYCGERLMRLNIEEKIELLYMHYKADISEIQKLHFWESFQRLKKIRNELTHYKNNYIGAVGFGYGVLQQFPKPLNGIGEYFTASEMQRAKNNIVALIARIATDFGLQVNTQVQLFSSPEHEQWTSIYDPNSFAGDNNV